MSDAEIFLQYLNNHYNELYFKYRQFCKEKGYTWDEDIFQDTILKCYEAIERKGCLIDTTPQGIENYFFISFKMNLKREGQYARNMKRDMNYTTDEVNQLYEDWYDNNKDDARTKIINDLYKDFSCLYIMTLVEQQFDNEHFYLFRLKSLCNYTYKQLADKTGMKGVRLKILTVKNWLRDNLTKDELNKAFQAMYGDLL